ncbi:MAG: LysR family transcriptional regulator [Clostridium sp.]|nr:LysR family transcriptional regulator [Clostridium sp.]
MELRVLKYFLTAAREENITKAARLLHITQPTLSKQLMELEDEIGKKLFIRGNRNITLTEEGVLLQKRAEEIIDLVSKTEKELEQAEDAISGDIHIGAGETDLIRYIARIAKNLQAEYPLVHFCIESGDAQTVYEQLDKGLIDFGLLFGNIDMSKYNCIEIPSKNAWGVLMRSDSELAAKAFITIEDLMDKPLIVSRQGIGSELQNWFKADTERLNIATTYNLVFNASIMVEEGVGYALTLDKIINTTGSNLCFVPLKPKLEIGASIVWKRHQVFSKASDKFLSHLLKELP